MIAAHALCKAYAPGHPVLERLSFEVRQGELALLVGANGVGKSTTLRLLCGLLRPDSGEVRIGGHSLQTARMAALGALAYLPQQIAFHPRLTCEAVLAFYLGLRGGGGRARVAELLELVGLSAEARKQTHALSGGLRQRLGLAVLLAPEAPVLLLDEPGLSLDPLWRERLKHLLQAEARRGRTILVATHLLAEWEGVADRALQLCPGGGAREVDPAHLRGAFGL